MKAVKANLRPKLEKENKNYPVSLKNEGKKHREMENLKEGRLAHAKFAYTTRRVPRDVIITLLPGEKHPKAGDLVLARVIKLGQHEHLELPDGRRAALFPGDEIVLTFGNRYAPDQFEAVVPGRLLSPCHLVAAGGIAAQTLHKHSKMHSPTDILPLGLLGDMDSHRINLSRWALTSMKPDSSANRPLTIAITGTSMNSGKTTVISSLTRGLISTGQRVAAAKISGTGAGGDHWRMIDAGANPALDFVDAGVASTYLLSPNEMDKVTDTILGHLMEAPVDIILLEISDGLLEPETTRLLAKSNLKNFLDAVIFTAYDAMGAIGGINWLRLHNLPVIAISGLISNSPLAMREALATAEIPIYSTGSLIQSEVASTILDCVNSRALSRRKEVAKENLKGIRLRP